MFEKYPLIIRIIEQSIFKGRIFLLTIHKEKIPGITVESIASYRQFNEELLAMSIEKPTSKVYVKNS